MSLRARLLTALAGDPEGAPRWVLALEDGDDAGYFAEDGAAWTVHSGTATLVAGIRALLLQALHPGALAGVRDWSRYREDPLGRLSGTVRWLLCTTFGSTEQADAETQRVARMHRRVAGPYQDAAGRPATYRADDSHLAEWVHVTFTDTFLTCHEALEGRRHPIPGGADAYVAEWAVAGRLMHVPAPPTTERELRDTLHAYLERGELTGGEHVAEVVRFLRRPPMSGAMGWGYRLYFAAAVATLTPQHRRMLRLRRSPLPVLTLTRLTGPVVQRALESGGPRAHQRARRRLERLRASARTQTDRRTDPRPGDGVDDRPAAWGTPADGIR